MKTFIISKPARSIIQWATMHLGLCTDHPIRFATTTTMVLAQAFVRVDFGLYSKIGLHTIIVMNSQGDNQAHQYSMHHINFFVKFVKDTSLLNW